MKQQQQLWNRAIDDFLPKDRQKWSVIQLYRGRALIRTCLMGSVLNPFLFLFENSAWDSWQQGIIAISMFMVPLLLIWLFHNSGYMKLCAGLYVALCTGITGWAQLASATLLSKYWIWFCFLIVFCVLMMGVRAGALYTALTILLCLAIFRDNVSHGFTIGRFMDKDALLASITVQVVAIQVSFLLLMTAYDAIRNRMETRAVLLRFTDDEADRLASVGERMGGMAQELNEQLKQFQGQILRLDVLAKRSDTKVEDLQNLIAELQQRSQKLAEISKISNG